MINSHRGVRAIPIIEPKMSDQPRGQKISHSISGCRQRRRAVGSQGFLAIRSSEGDDANDRGAKKRLTKRITKPKATSQAESGSMRAWETKGWRLDQISNIV